MKIKKGFELIRRFFKDIDEYSLSVAIARLRRDIPIGSWEKRRTYYENSVYDYLEKRYSSLIRACIDDYDEEKSKRIEKKYIWVMWWQGIDQMPPIVKACYQQLLSVSDGNIVTLLTKDNWQHYVNLPDHIYEKFKAGIITITHLSDIIRANLLKQWGGAWIDATVFAAKIPEEMFESEIFTLSGNGMFPDFISRGEWVPFLLCTNRTNTVFATSLSDLLCKYWVDHADLIDYLLVDYFILLLKRSLKEVNNAIQSNNENRSFYDLLLCINQPYSPEIINDILSRSCFQKLSYKYELLEKTMNDEMTFYGTLVSEYGLLK